MIILRLDLGSDKLLLLTSIIRSSHLVWLHKTYTPCSMYRGVFGYQFEIRYYFTLSFLVFLLQLQTSVINVRCLPTQRFQSVSM